DLTAPQQLSFGQIVPWTPRFALQYFWLLSQLSPADGVQGIRTLTWRSLAASSRLYWSEESITELVGSDVAVDLDPLDRKLPDMNHRGKRMLACIGDVLTAAGTHDLTVIHNDDSTSDVAFVPISFSALIGGGASYSVYLQRKDRLEDANSLYDFRLADD